VNWCKSALSPLTAASTVRSAEVLFYKINADQKMILVCFSHISAWTRALQSVWKFRHACM
jgi:hypothetical protein